MPCANLFFAAQRFQKFMDRPYSIIPHYGSDKETFDSRPTDGQRKIRLFKETKVPQKTYVKVRQLCDK